LVFFLHDTNSNIIGAIRDVKGDDTGGYKTTPVLYGIKTALVISVLLSLSYLMVTAGILWFSQLIVNPLFFVALFVIGIIVLCVMYILLFTSLHSLTRKQALFAHELFVAERVIFASAFLVGIVLSPALSFSLCVISLLITLLSQHLLRERYELT
jgi:4-hydroxybenzoate polyprenyltransferase/geranylgeranylglycerol-phosphate geranylgeranyltransferase